MRRLIVATTLAGGLAGIAHPPAVHAGPPTPPATPPCRSCGGPPPAPTPVPTLAATMVLPDTRPMAVQISPTTVKRGGQTQVAVLATPEARVTMEVHYVHVKPVVYRATVGKTGRLVKKWKVSRTAPLGKASVKITIAGASEPYTATVSFTVVK